MQARSYCLYCTYPPSSLGQIDDLRARLAALQQAAVKVAQAEFIGPRARRGHQFLAPPRATPKLCPTRGALYVDA